MTHVFCGNPVAVRVAQESTPDNIDMGWLPRMKRGDVYFYREGDFDHKVAGCLSPEQFNESFVPIPGMEEYHELCRRKLKDIRESR